MSDKDLKIFGLDKDFSLNELESKYKKLLKEFDTKNIEDDLKIIFLEEQVKIREAYQTLLKHYHEKEKVSSIESKSKTLPVKSGKGDKKKKILAIIMTALLAIVLGFIFQDNIGNLFSGQDTVIEEEKTYEEEDDEDDEDDEDEEIIYEIIQGVDTFNYTGDMQTYTVPAGVTIINIETYGAEGGLGFLNGNPASGGPGLGGYSSGDLVVTPGQTLNIYVGGQGGSNSYNSIGGWNGGGYSIDDDSDMDDAGGGGGGASDIRIGGTSLSNRVIVAGGGGGAGKSGYYGGNGGGYSGSAGTGGINATGGTQFTGFALGLGGNSTTSMTNKGGAAAGGGGGYYGGNVAITPDNYYTGGGGGSSYIGGVINGITNSGIKEGNGLVIISYCINCDSKKEGKKKEETELEIEITRPEPPPKQKHEEEEEVPVVEETPVEELEEEISVEQLIPGCWSLKHQWKDCTGYWHDGEFCFKSNGIMNCSNSYQWTWDLNGNNISIISERGTKYTGVYKNGVITGTIINYEGNNGCFKLYKK